MRKTGAPTPSGSGSAVAAEMAALQRALRDPYRLLAPACTYGAHAAKASCALSVRCLHGLGEGPFQRKGIWSDKPKVRARERETWRRGRTHHNAPHRIACGGLRAAAIAAIAFCRAQLRANEDALARLVRARAPRAQSPAASGAFTCALACLPA
jgi:hypothetical protein